jgi:hypothetical protein
MKIEVAKTGFANLPVEKRVYRQSANARSFEQMIQIINLKTQ